MDFSINTKEIAIENELHFKFDENLIIIYDEDMKYKEGDEKNKYKSVIFDVKTGKPIATQYNKIIYGFENVDKFIKDHEHTKITASKCYEGTHLIVFYYNDIWYICTRKCLDASDVYWNSNISYYDMFTDAMNGKFSFSDLNKDYCYHFNLIHYMNRRNIDYTEEFGEKYKVINLIMITEKETMKIIDEIIPNVFIPEKIEITDVNELRELIEKMNIEENNKNIYLKNEGYVINHFDKNGVLSILKIQTPFYEFMHVNTSNVFDFDYPKFDICCQAYINTTSEIQKLLDIMFEDKQTRHMFMKKIIKNYSIIADTCNALYFITRKKANPRIYNELSTAYKNIIYKINGIYLSKVKEDKTFKINIGEVLNVLKSISIKEFKELVFGYINIIESTHNFNKQSPIEQIYYPTMMF
jgi:hypothetical protein